MKLYKPHGQNFIQVPRNVYPGQSFDHEWQRPTDPFTRKVKLTCPFNGGDSGGNITIESVARQFSFHINHRMGADVVMLSRAREDQSKNNNTAAWEHDVSNTRDIISSGQTWLPALQVRLRVVGANRERERVNFLPSLQTLNILYTTPLSRCF